MKSFVMILTLAWSFFISASAIAAGSTLSYGALAEQSVEKAWTDLQDEAQVLNKSGILPHETKNLRKKIVALREVLDLFAYAYWKTEKRKQDPWLQIRDQLDIGYELIGSYKDLYDVQAVNDPAEASYDLKEVAKIRREVQEWWSLWSRSSANVYSYLSQPSTTEIYLRDKSDLSKFYWGASDLVPNLELNGEENLAALSKDLLITAINGWPEVRQIKNPTKNLELENRFHDFRKRLRSTARILRTYPALFNGQEEDLDCLEKLADRYGAINDKILIYHKAIKNDKNKKAEKLKDQIKEEWLELVAEQDGLVLELLQNILRTVS